jgi:hypothetical protein
MGTKPGDDCPFYECPDIADTRWPGDELAVLESVAVNLSRPEQVEGTELWACDKHAGLLSAILGAAQPRP